MGPELLFISLLAGFLTVLAPCMLAVLPVIVGGSIGVSAKPDTAKALRIVASLALSVTVFTLLLKGTTELLAVPQEVWRGISGGLVVLLGVFQLFPQLWERLALGMNLGANRALRAGSSRRSALGDIIIGAALGPVFTSCSPVYGLLIAVVLPASFTLGALYVLIYAIGLAAALLLLALAGQRLIARLRWAANPTGMFRRGLAVLFIAVGLSIIFGWDKLGEAWLLERGLYDGTTGLENLLR
ncbi:cytochrome C biogenesis protein [Candidatus Saccharibacteria bacterium]|nr:cytochrome C biogenesis protein [Candidatus Saccharibacteria bacterium]